MQIRDVPFTLHVALTHVFRRELGLNATYVLSKEGAPFLPYSYAMCTSRIYFTPQVGSYLIFLRMFSSILW